MGGRSNVCLLCATPQERQTNEQHWKCYLQGRHAAPNGRGTYTHDNGTMHACTHMGESNAHLAEFGNAKNVFSGCHRAEVAYCRWLVPEPESAAQGLASQSSLRCLKAIVVTHRVVPFTAVIAVQTSIPPNNISVLDMQ
jgi:hypothetical protein